MNDDKIEIATLVKNVGSILDNSVSRRFEQRVLSLIDTRTYENINGAVHCLISHIMNPTDEFPLKDNQSVVYPHGVDVHIKLDVSHKSLIKSLNSCIPLPRIPTIQEFRDALNRYVLPTKVSDSTSIYNLYSALKMAFEDLYPLHERVETAKGGAKKQRKSSKRPATKWTRTTKKVTVTSRDGKKTQKTLYRNAATGELRVRKMVTRAGKKVAAYVVAK
jgi:hypothetical protein